MLSIAAIKCRYKILLLGSLLHRHCVDSMKNTTTSTAITVLITLLVSAMASAASPLKEAEPSSVIKALNDSGDMTLLGGNYIIRYHSSASESNRVISLITRQLKYKAENTHMFNGPIPEAVPYIRANINICDIKSLAAQLPGAGAFGKLGSDPVLALELGGVFRQYETVSDNTATSFDGDSAVFTFYIRANKLLDISQQLQTAQIHSCSSNNPAILSITSLYHSGEVSAEQAEKLINQ